VCSIIALTEAFKGVIFKKSSSAFEEKSEGLLSLLTLSKTLILSCFARLIPLLSFVMK